MVERAFAVAYRSGRVHECELKLAQPLRPGDRFELNGRHWRVRYMLREDRRQPEARTLVGALALTGG